ncbi:MAG: BrnT family toxin [Bacteroidota bacterium]|nr:BrnT family toxin [Bacteroidota bacterium]
MGYTFEWDANKAETNFRKHGVSFEEVATVFYDTSALEMVDKKHSRSESRWIILGHSVANRLLVAIFTVREENIRIISARSASKKERKSYEESGS